MLCIISGEGEDVNRKSENFLVTAGGAGTHMAVRVPLHDAHAVGRSSAEGDDLDGFFVLVHGYIIHASARDVKGVRRKTFKS